MKKIIAFMGLCLMAVPALADEYGYGYDNYGYGYDTTPRRDTYVGMRIHKNENIAFRVESDGWDGTTIRDDRFGFGIVVGNRLTDHIKIEFESEYTYGGGKKYGTEYDFDIWSNMLNVYLYQQFGGAVEPYAGLGIGMSGLWGDMGGAMNMSDATADMSWGAMIGVNFALNTRIDLNLGIKYQNYGDLDMQDDNGNTASIEVDGTEFYIGAVYKFGL